MLASHFASRFRAARQVMRSAHIPAAVSHQTTELGPTVQVAHQAQNELVEAADELDGITIVRDRQTAASVVRRLMSLPADAIVAWDTETTGVNPAKESPVGKGSVICATAFAGDKFDFGAGPRLFIDCYEGGPGASLLDVFEGYFRNERCKKVWHNYAFDRHMLMNHGLDVKGFGGDTMHMARLVDSSRQKYSLQELSAAYLSGIDRKKLNMADRFGRPEILKNGTAGKKTVVPETTELMTSNEYRDEWIDYATADAMLTFELYNTLRRRLEEMAIGSGRGPGISTKFKNMYKLYEDLLIPFGEVLTKIERRGFQVDVEWLKKAEELANEDRLALEEKFRSWAQTKSPDARYMNVNSDLQKQQLFFAPYENRKEKVALPKEALFCIKPAEFLPTKYVHEIFGNLRHGDTGSDGGQKNATDLQKKQKTNIKIVGLGKKVVETTQTGLPSVSGAVLQKLAGKPRADPPQYGDPTDPAFCLAVDDLVSATRVSTLISTFLRPLQDWPGLDGRIHASLNINTETGRLSSRRPNLQNQPALDKDRYRVRKAFVPEKGNSLIVADYGQLELRLLAHITECKSMIEAFRAGGDFHSRTALSMFADVQKAVENGDCLLEHSETSHGKENPPLLKDMFSSQRRKAKTLNFSIAYGKTVRGLAKDWNVSEVEAGKTLELWYNDRQEVLKWQKEQVEFLKGNGFVETILGRRRHLPGINNSEYRVQQQAKRAAINAPLQGSAADLVMASMVKLSENRTLSALGWKIILQVHDEVILEGPEESADIAFPIIVEQMKRPIDIPLKVELTVHAKCVKSWYDAK